MYRDSSEQVVPIQDNVTGVRPYQKKIINGIPGSSPLVRSGEDDLNYHQRYGKGPLMERAERLRRLQELIILFLVTLDVVVAFDVVKCHWHAQEGQSGHPGELPLSARRQEDKTSDSVEGRRR